jgi:hypothetical protein
MRKALVVLALASLAVTAAMVSPGRSSAQTQTFHFIVTGAGPGGGPHVRVFHPDGSDTGVSFFPYCTSFHGGVHVGTADLDNDGTSEILTGAGPGGGPDVGIFDTGGQTIGHFFAYDAGFGGGVYVAGGKVNTPDGTLPFIVTGAGPGGGPDVRIFVVSDQGLFEVADFMAYGAGFTGGVQVAAADIDNDGTDEIITGAGPGGGPDVRVFKIDPVAGEISLAADFFAYGSTFRGGVFVAGTAHDANPANRVVTGAGPGGGPDVRSFSGAGALASDFFAYGPTFAGGVNVATANFGNDESYEFVTGPGQGGGPNVRVFSATGTQEASFFPYDPAFGGGVFVATGQVSVTVPTTTSTLPPTTTTTGPTTTTTTGPTTTTTTGPTTTTTAGPTTTTTTAPTTTTSTTAPTTTTT